MENRAAAGRAGRKRHHGLGNGLSPGSQDGDGRRPDRYRWVALSNTTLSMLMATIDGSIVIIAMPAIFRGIHLDPTAPGNISYLLWMIIGYLLVTAVLVVTLGRLGDMFGRVQDLQPGLRGLHAGLHRPVAGSAARRRRARCG